MLNLDHMNGQDVWTRPPKNLVILDHTLWHIVEGLVPTCSCLCTRLPYTMQPYLIYMSSIYPLFSMLSLAPTSSFFFPLLIGDWATSHGSITHM